MPSTKRSNASKVSRNNSSGGQGKAQVKKVPVSFGRGVAAQPRKATKTPPVIDTPEGTIEANVEEAAP
jgi:hypothetical protein